MNARVITAIACLLIGIPLAAWALASGQLLIALAGFALIFTFLFLVVEAMSKAAKSKQPLKPAANTAWSMKDQPSNSVPPRDGEAR
jgi:hypothetical protein